MYFLTYYFHVYLFIYCFFLFQSKANYFQSQLVVDGLSGVKVLVCDGYASGCGKSKTVPCVLCVIRYTVTYVSHHIILAHQF